MIAASAPTFRVVLYEGIGSQPLDAQTRSEAMRLLLEKGYAATRTRTGGQVSDASAGVVAVLGRFDNGQAPAIAQDGSADVTLHFRNIEGLAAAEIVEVADSIRSDANLPKPGGWKPWFPVIDYGRCTNCMQCLSFCLFDVYGVSGGGKIQVQNQNNCKTDCPACSRVCPEVAILFPKYRHGPINGDEVSADDLRREAMKVDISALLGGDIYQALRDRSTKAQSRFSKERDEDRALKERQRCLTKLQEQMDIPPEVLGALPSLDHIQARAQQAKAKADEALKAASAQPAV